MNYKITNFMRMPVNKTLEGVLVNNHVKENNDRIDFDKICDNLIISQNSQTQNASPASKYNPKNPSTAFDMKKALVPLVVGTGILFSLAALTSLGLKKASISLLNSEKFQKLPDLALNMNIMQEPQFATYRMLRDPNLKNILGMLGVFVMSGLTLVGKNFVDGAKEIWIKKQEADIERDLQEKLIEVETNVFAGKLNEVHKLLTGTVKYFKERLSFKGHIEQKPSQNEGGGNLSYLLTVGGILAASALLAKFTFSNFKKVLKAANNFTNNYNERIVNTVENMAKNVVKGSDKGQFETLKNLFQAANYKGERIKGVMEKMGFDKNAVENMVRIIEEGRKTIFADAPTSLGGIPQKIQYYCYLDEDRGHLYNWIIHPENNFMKQIFLAFTAITSIGYFTKQAFDAIKTVMVHKENSNTQLDLKRRLVEVEIENFKSKKNSAIHPMIEDFDKKLKSGKPKHALKKLAENILLEIKNGPPYVYS